MSDDASKTVEKALGNLFKDSDVFYGYKINTRISEEDPSNIMADISFIPKYEIQNITIEYPPSRLTPELISILNGDDE